MRALRRRVEDPRVRLEPIPPDTIVHHFVLRERSDVDDTVCALLLEAYETYG